jgi:siroheme synthase
MEEKEEELDWRALAHLKGALIILMGVGTFGNNVNVS